MQDIWDYLQLMWHQAGQRNVSAVMFWIAVYSGVVGLISLIGQLRVRRWPVTTGVLAEAGLEQWGGTEWVKSDQDYMLQASYRYEVDGRKMEGHRVSPWLIIASHNARGVLKAQLKGVQRHEDGTVSVFYNPKRPEKSYLILPGVFGLLITWVIILGPAFAYWHRVYGG